MPAPVISSIRFEDITGLPEVHSDARRTIYEKTDRDTNGVHRISRSVVSANDAVMGNHYHRDATVSATVAAIRPLIEKVGFSFFE